MVFVDFFDEATDNLGILCGEVIVFMRICSEVVKRRFATLHHQFPVATPHTEHIGLMKLPKEMVVPPLTSFARQCRKDTDAICPLARNSVDP